MSRKTHSRAVKLGATVLYRLAGEGAAVAAFGIDASTLRSWVSNEPLPADDWEQAEQLLLARGLEMSARGQTSGLVATLTAAGISSRNRRYSELIRRREQRREAEQPKPEQPDPVKLAIDALRDDQQRLMRDTIDTVMLEQGDDLHPALQTLDPPTLDADHEKRMLEWIAYVAALSEEEVATQLSGLDARNAEARRLIDAERQRIADEAAAARAPRPPDPPQTAPAPITPLLAPPDAVEPLPAPSWPFGLHVVSDQERNDPYEHGHPSWRRER